MRRIKVVPGQRFTLPYSGTVVPGGHEAVISDDDFQSPLVTRAVTDGLIEDLGDASIVRFFGEGPPGPAGPQGPPGRDGAPGATGPVGPAGSATEWVPEVILDGVQAVGVNVLPPGIRCPKDTTLREVVLRAGTNPVGAALSIRIRANGSGIGIWSIPSGQATSTTVLANPEAIGRGAIITYDVTAVGSSTPGSDVAVQMICS